VTSEQLALIEEPQHERMRPFTLEAGQHDRTTGQSRTERSDPDEFERVVAAVRKTADECSAFTADYVDTFRRPAVGAAFSCLRKLGEIEVVGYEASHRAQAHGRLQRVRRRA
jgi:hypothetical protein